jgi:hypothetical protein
MTIQELRRAKNKQPFEPFVLHMADGRLIRVRHPDVMAWEPAEYDPETGETAEPRMVHVLVPDGWESVDLELVTSLAFVSPEPGGQPKPKRKRRGT